MVGWLTVLGLLALWDSISVSIKSSLREREKEKEDEIDKSHLHMPQAQSALAILLSRVEEYTLTLKFPSTIVAPSAVVPQGFAKLLGVE